MRPIGLVIRLSESVVLIGHTFGCTLSAAAQVNGMDWPGHPVKHRSPMKLYRNNRNGTFTDVTAKAGLDPPM